MISYKDQAWCKEFACRRFHESLCFRAFTRKVARDAQDWAGNPEPPVTFFTDKPSCYEEEAV